LKLGVTIALTNQKSLLTCADDSGVRSAVFRSWFRPTIVYCPVDNTLFRVRRDLLCACVKSLLLFWKPCSWFWGNLKTF